MTLTQRRTLRNILIAAAVGVVTGLLLGGLAGDLLSSGTRTVGVGVVTGITFVLLNSRKETSDQK